MKLKELYGLLSDGELSNLSMAEDTPGQIADKSKRKIIRYVNDGLRNLFSRFQLLEKIVMVQMHRHVTNYHLLPQFAMCSDSEEPIKYILDLPEEQFIDDVVKILTVYNSCNHVIPLNDDTRPWSIFTPQGKMIQVPRPLHGECLSITYQAHHAIIQYDDEEQEVNVPPVLESALTAFIAYRVFSHMNTQESTAKAQEHMSFYEAECQRVEEKDLVNSSMSTGNVRFYKNGWI